MLKLASQPLQALKETKIVLGENNAKQTRQDKVEDTSVKPSGAFR